MDLFLGSSQGVQHTAYCFLLYFPVYCAGVLASNSVEHELDIFCDWERSQSFKLIQCRFLQNDAEKSGRIGILCCKCSSFPSLQGSISMFFHRITAVPTAYCNAAVTKHAY